MANQQYNQKYSSIYQGLNARQKEAVDQIEGPVMVIAGPGTGKTQILAARIANILLQTDALPENILCLTYTDAGTIAMRKRLLEFIGPDAYRVSISTFHGFCNMVIQENLDVFGFRNLDPVSDLEEIQILRELVDELPKNHILKRYTGDVYYEVYRLLSLFSIMKREDWAPEFLIGKTALFIEEIKTRDEYIYKRAGKRKDGSKYVKGDLNEEKLADDLKRLEQMLAAVSLYEPFQERLQQNNRYDFSDMILWVIKAFKENAGLLSTYQERFLYILVDEFQDTSGSQNDLLQLLIGYWDQPNIFVVGDDDQSIYRFQGANVENIENFIQQFTGNIKKVSLEDNYRSTQAILDASKKLIGQNTRRLERDKNLLAKNPGKTRQTNIPRIVEYYNTAHESTCIAKEIEALHLGGTPLNEIAVLYRNHAQADEMMRFLTSKAIEVNSRKRVDILHEPLIKKIIQVMRYLQAESKIAHSGEPFLFEILHYDEFTIPTLEIARLSVFIASKNFMERQTSWRDELRLMAQKKQADLFESNTYGKELMRFSQTLEYLIQQVPNITVQELIQAILTQCGFLVSALNSSEKTWQMELLNTFFDFVKSECAKNPQSNLASLTQLFNLMEDNNISLPAEKIIYSENGVNFITAHSSKGLEFEHVYIIGCNSNKWDKARANRDYKLPDNIFDLPGDETEETRRLFYVAMTRAKSHLTLSYCKQDNNLKELEPSRFIAEISEGNFVQTERPVASEESLLDFFMAIREQVQGGIPASIIDNAFTDSLLEKYSLSVTHLNSYLKCPVAFYFNNFIKVPSPKGASMTFGSAVHYALEQLFKKMNSHENREFPEVDVFVKDFKWYLRRNQESFVEAEYKRRVEYGESILPKYYENYIHDWNKVTSIEKSYRNVVMEGIPLNGKLDKMEFDGNFVNVVDYKTGQYKNAKKKFNRPDYVAVEESNSAGKEPGFEDQFGGDYWRQAVFYKLLMDYDQTKVWEMRSSEFDFIEPVIKASLQQKEIATFHKERIQITSEDVSIVKTQIKDVYSKIMNKEFTKGCEKEDCIWCSFTRNYYTGNARLNGNPVELSED